MFQSYYDNKLQKAQPIAQLVKAFEANGTEGLDVACSEELSFTADEWKAMNEKQQQETLMNYRIAYLGETMVNWCPQLGTVLANILSYRRRCANGVCVCRPTPSVCSTDWKPSTGPTR